MQRSIPTKLFRHPFWLSALLHLLALFLLFVFFTAPVKQFDKHPTPNEFVPAYTYTGSIKPIMQHPTAQPKQQTESQPTPAENTAEKTVTSAENIQKTDAIPLQKINKKTSVSKHQPRQPSLLAASFDMLQDQQLQDVSKARDAEPIYLIGDDSSPADPLVKLMGRSLSAHFAYPRTAGELGIHGKVIIELTLHPEGYYSDVQILKSSSSQDLDAAALYAVNSAPKVIGANRYINKPRHFVVGFIFY